MALISCPECGKPVSSTCSVCPHCGFTMPSPQGGQNKSEGIEMNTVVKRAMVSRGRLAGLMSAMLILGVICSMIFIVWGACSSFVLMVVFGIILLCAITALGIVALAKGMRRSGTNNENTRPVIAYDKNKGKLLVTSLGKGDLYLTPSQAKEIRFEKNWMWGNDVQIVWYGQQLLGFCALSGQSDLSKFLRSLDNVSDEEKALCKKN